ncbi:MAG: hypothetical protein RJA70_2440 [Pseudomonadota bacterium]
MSALWLLLTLLVVAYFGSILAGGRTIAGFGLPSGVEWLLVGFAFGPQALGIFDSSTIRQFEPLAIVALAWGAMVIGLDYGHAGRRRISPRGLLLGIALTTLCLAGVGVAVLVGLRFISHLSGLDAYLIAGTVATVSCETTRQAIRWVSERYHADGPLARCLADIADGEDIVPVLALVTLFAFVPRAETLVAIVPPGWLAITLGVGLMFGLLGSVLIRRSLAHGESWGVLIGVALLGTGIAAQLQLSTVGALFCVGLTLTIFSRKELELRQSLQRTERPVLLPVLLLAGASIDFAHAGTSTWLVVLIALGARVLFKGLAGLLVATRVRAARAAPFSVGLGLMPAGNLTLCVALSCYMSLPAELGQFALLTAVVVTLVGELVGPLALRRALHRAGEIAGAGVTALVAEPALTAAEPTLTAAEPTLSAKESA